MAVDRTPSLGTIVKVGNGSMGFSVYRVGVTYPGEPTSTVTFVGSARYEVSPVVMVTPENPGGTLVTDPSRFGAFGPEWVRRFYA